MSHFADAERGASHRSRITLRVGSQFTGSREKIGDQDPDSVPGLFSLSMPPKDLQIHRWGWQLTSQLIIKAEIDALHIQFQKLQIEPVVVIHPIIPAFRRLKKVGYIVSPRTACTIEWNPVSETKKGKKMPTFPKTKPYSLDGRPKMEQLLWIRSLPQVYTPHLLDLTGWGCQGKASSWRKTDSDCLQPRLSQSVSVKFCVGKISRREHYVSCINYLQIGRSIDRRVISVGEWTGMEQWEGKHYPCSDLGWNTVSKDLSQPHSSGPF